MKNLLYKEFRLVIHPLCYVAALFCALLLIPQWVYFLVPMYFILTVLPNLFTSAKAVNDTGFSVMLPVRKRDIVKARVLSVVVLELVQVAAAAIFAFFNRALYPQGNFLIDANIAYVGGIFAIYGLFNAVFFPMYYRTAYKIAWPIITATIVTVLFVTAIEMLVILVPAAAYVLDGISGEALARQLPVLISGIAAFALLSLLAYRLSARRFERVDL